MFTLNENCLNQNGFNKLVEPKFYYYKGKAIESNRTVITKKPQTNKWLKLHSLVANDMNI